MEQGVVWLQQLSQQSDNVTSGYLQLEVLHLNAFGTHSWEILGVIGGQLIYGTMYWAITNLV